MNNKMKSRVLIIGIIGVYAVLGWVIWLALQLKGIVG